MATRLMAVNQVPQFVIENGNLSERSLNKDYASETFKMRSLGFSN